MTRAPLAWVLLGAVITAWVASAMLGGDSEAEAVAAARLDMADSFAAHAREDSSRNAQLAAAYTADSTRWEAERAAAEDSRESSERAAAAAQRRASAVATDLTARLDSTEASLFMQYRTEVDSIAEATDRVIAALKVRDATKDAEIASLHSQLFAKDQELGSVRAENVQLRGAIEALEEQIRGLQPSALERIGDLAEKGLAGKALIDMVAS